MTIDEWLQSVRTALNRPGKSLKDLAHELELSSSYVSRLLKGERAMKTDVALKIAAYTGIPLPDSTQSGGESAGQPPVGTGSIIAGPVAIKRVRGRAIIAPGVWREGDYVLTQVANIPANPDPRFSNMEQYWVQIEAQPNRYAICAPYFALRARPLDGDIVHVTRLRPKPHSAGYQREDTLRRVRTRKERVELWLDGAKRADMLVYPAPRDTGEVIEIQGLVIGYFENTFAS